MVNTVRRDTVSACMVLFPPEGEVSCARGHSSGRVLLANKTPLPVLANRLSRSLVTPHYWCPQGIAVPQGLATDYMHPSAKLVPTVDHVARAEYELSSASNNTTPLPQIHGAGTKAASHAHARTTKPWVR